LLSFMDRSRPLLLLENTAASCQTFRPSHVLGRVGHKFSAGATAPPRVAPLADSVDPPSRAQLFYPQRVRWDESEAIGCDVCDWSGHAREKSDEIPVVRNSRCSCRSFRGHSSMAQVVVTLSGGASLQRAACTPPWSFAPGFFTPGARRY